MGDIGDLVLQAVSFRATLEAAKMRIPRDFDWYPYDTLANVQTMDRLLTGQWRSLLDLVDGKPVLDIGCADGDLAFFFESQGCDVQAIDNPVTNFNAMLGIRALRDELKSSVEILSMDIDTQFALPADEYGLVLLLGLLYHLKNPFYALEKLSKHARYCLMSSVITGYMPGLYESVAGTPVVYLADVYEVNRDSTNYWLLSDAGFRRLLGKSNWEICNYLLISEGEKTGPGSIGAQRAFCLAKSKYVDCGVVTLYGRGWHAAEKGGWRWTEKNFSVRFESSRAASADEVRLNLFLPEGVVARFGKITLRATANGVPLPAETYSEPGQYEYRKRLPADTGESDVRIDFSLDQALPADASDGRERGIVVCSLEAVRSRAAR
jgi:tRNA (mo5U34)-methyltransferase